MTSSAKRIPHLTILLVAVHAFLALECARPELPSLRPNEADETHTLLLISIDGFRFDYLDIHSAPNLNALATDGVRSGGLIPVFPTLTFPNHYTIATGLYPARHGIVGNRFYDPELDRSFRYSNPEDAADSVWWGGEPIWITAGKNGLRSAVYFWPGSETVIEGRRPDYWYHFDGDVPGEERVAQALRWLDLPDEERPAFIALYFEDVDRAAHGHGPESAETAAAIRVVDEYIGQLVRGLSSRGLFDTVSIILVSDHGQTRRVPENVVYLEDYIDLSAVRILDYGPTTAMWPTGLSASALFERLDRAHPHLSAYTRNNMPERWHYEGSPRIPPIVIVLDDGWTFGRRKDDNPAFHSGGGHGYDPAAKTMWGLFVAHGPAFNRGVVLPAFESIHLYALMADILDIEPAPNQGSLSATAASRKPAEDSQTRPK